MRLDAPAAEVPVYLPGQPSTLSGYAVDFRAALDTIADESKPLRAATIMVLSDAGASEASLFRQVWCEVPVARRRQVVQRLVDIAEDNPEADFHPLLRACLSDPDAEVRAAALPGLWEDESPFLADLLVALLKTDASAQVRAAAAGALRPFALRASLGELKGTRCEVIRRALLDASGNVAGGMDVRCEALKSVGYWEDDEVRQAILMAYRHDDPRVKASAVHAMGANLDPAWRKAVLVELASPYPEVRFEAAEAAGEMEERAAVPSLIELLQDADVEVAQSAAGALGMIGGPAARTALRACASSANPALREAGEAALEAMLFFEDPLAVPDGSAELGQVASAAHRHQPPSEP